MEPKLTPTYADTVGSAVEQRHEPAAQMQMPPIIPRFEPQPYTLSSVTPVEPAKAVRKVAIIGTAPSSRDLAPYNDPSWSIWCCSPGNQNIVPRVTRWFELHVNLDWNENKHYGLPYIEWLRQKIREGAFPEGLWMQDRRYIAEATIFPKDAMVKEFGPYFFTSTFAWLMALAISEGANEIGLWGVDMASHDEYVRQRPGGQFFINECKKRGIKVTIPYESDLEQPSPLYAYAEATPLGRKIMAREIELKTRINPMEQQVKALQDQILYLKGALEDIDYFKSLWMGSQEGTRELGNNSLSGS